MGRPRGQPDFDTKSSDVDFLIVFATDAAPSLTSFFAAKAELEYLLCRGIDLVESGAVRNPFLLPGINRNCEAVYE